MDGSWAGTVVDHICKLLFQYAVLADLECKRQKDQKQVKEGEYQSAHARLEKTQTFLEGLFR